MQKNYSGSLIVSPGFTLVEMSVVLVIIGLMMTAAISVGSTQLTLNRLLTTKQRAEAIKTALISYIARNNRLPCPAVPTIAPEDAGYGTEAPLPGTCTGAMANGTGSNAVFSGIIPWASVGVSEEAASDGYYNRFTYQVSASATRLNASTIAGLIGNQTVHSGTPVTLGLTPGGNQVNDCSFGATNPCAAVVVILSHGANGAGAYTSSGNRIELPNGGDEQANIDGDRSVIIKDFVQGGANEFDDILLVLNANDLLSPLTNNGVIKTSQARLNEQFEAIVGAVITKAINGRSNDSPGSRSYPLPNTIPSLSSSIMLDPWGHQIQYDRLVASINVASSFTIDTAFSLTSYGADGVVSGGDDVTRIVTVGELQAKFTSYGW